jgi:hypothetical protein
MKWRRPGEWFLGHSWQVIAIHNFVGINLLEMVWTPPQDDGDKHYRLNKSLLRYLLSVPEVK